MASYTWPPESGSGGGVSSLNSLTGALTLVGGTGISVTPSGSNITIASTGTSFPLLAPDGTAAAPSYSFAAHAASGIYFNASSGSVNITNSNFDVLVAGASSLSVGVPIYNINGTVSAPSYTFTAHVSSGLYYNASSGSVNISNSNADILVAGSSSLSVSVPIYNIDGSAAAPSYAFTSDHTSGIYLTAATVHTSISGLSVLEIGATQTFLRNQLLDMRSANSGADNNIVLRNQSNTAGSGSVIESWVQGTSAGNPYFRTTVNGGTDWAFGLDQGNSNRFSIAQNNTLGSNDFLTISTAGAVQIGATSGTQQHILNTAIGTNAGNTLTLTNAPSAVVGNPTGYIQITINGGTHYMPYW